MNVLTTFVSNSTTAHPTTQPAPISVSSLVSFSLYAVFGSVSILANLLVIVSLLRTKQLREAYILQIALAGGDLMNGIAYLGSGATRVSFLIAGTSSLPVTRWQCIIRFYVSFLVLGNQIPPAMELLISIDRFLAVAKPMAYFAAADQKKKIFLITSGVVYAICFASWSFSFLAAFLTGSVVTSNACATPDAVGPVYGIYNYAFALSTGLSSCVVCVLTAILMKVQNRRLSTDSVAMNRLKLEARLTKMMIIVVSLALIFSTTPDLELFSTTIIFDVYGVANASAYSAYFSIAFCFHSTLNVIVYATRNEEMRRAFLYVILCGRYGPAVAVGPAQSTTTDRKTKSKTVSTGLGQNPNTAGKVANA